MKFDNSKIQFSKFDIHRGINLPKHLNEELAYLVGFHLGDGHMRQYRRSFGSIESTIFYDGHSINEYSHYEHYVCPLIKQLFNYKCKIKVRKNSNNLTVIIGSRAIVDFMHLQCNLPLGPKTNACIPEIIKNANIKIKCAFLMGLADTDGSIVFKRKDNKYNDYPMIDFQMKSQHLIKDMAEMLRELGFNLHSSSRIKKRYEVEHESHYIQLNGTKTLRKWMKLIGFTSPNHLTKIQVWEKYGHLPPRTNIIDRIKMLELGNNR